MSNVTKIILGLAIATFTLGVVCTFYVYGKVVKARTFEVVINTAIEENKNVHSNMVSKVREIAQVPTMYADDLQRVVSTALEARYGEEGSKAMFQWIKEHDINLDASLYKKLQQVIESSRNDFAASQTVRIDKVQQYELMLTDPMDEAIVGFFGYPRIDLAKAKAPVVTEKTVNAFETGRDEPMQLR